ncbi:MAG: hypothetical protein JO104_08525 [Candidatus Eremiobacteraeota bacterium]|nr:hypothetical protein [Candidatus Eremiobacteraeota bacterium]
MPVCTESSVPAPRLRAARLEDYQDIRRLGLEYSLDVPGYEDWSGLWLDNPLRADPAKDFPIGWVLEAHDDELVGCMGTAWARYTFRGNNLIAAVARAWFVTAEYRGYALELLDEYLNQPGVDLFINNAVSNAAHAAFSQFCAPVPLGRWDSMSYWITGHRGFAERVLKSAGAPFPSILAYPLGAGLWAKDVAAARRPHTSPRAFTADSTDRFDSRFDTFWRELVRQNPEKLLADRSAAALSWHFAIPMRKRRLWILTASRNGQLRAYCTLTRQDHAFRLPALTHDDAQGIRAMRLVDYQSVEPEVDYLSGLLGEALRRCAKEGVYILEYLGRDVPKMRVVDDTAPHRTQLENWKFYYHASDPALSAELREPMAWDPSAYDGDASFE